MSYFGGTVSRRPWPRLDLRFVILLILSVTGIIAAVLLARDTIMSRLHTQEVQLQSQPAIVQPPQPVPADSIINVSVPVLQKKTEVLVAIDTIPAGIRLRPSMFRMETRVDDNSLSDRAMLNLNELEGAFSRVSLGSGSPLLKDSISPLSAASDITDRIPPGYRAVAIPVNIVTGVEGWVQPGARVDVVWTTENRSKMITTTLVENAQVLSAERRLESKPGSQDHSAGAEIAPVPNHVTLLVSTKDSQKLQLAKNSGSLSLSLRGDTDVDPGNAATLSTDSIIKNRNQRGPEDGQGQVSFGGKDYVLSGSSLIPRSEYQARAKMKESADF